MTTDPNWLKSLTESYKQEVSESVRNLQEEADQMFNLIETIQTALNVDLTEEQVDALIEAFRSTVDSETGEHRPGLIRKGLTGIFGGVGMSAKNAKKQKTIHGEIDAHNDNIDRQNTEIEGKNKEEQADHDSRVARALKDHGDRRPKNTTRMARVDDYVNSHGHQIEKMAPQDPEGSIEKGEQHDKEGKELEKRLSLSGGRSPFLISKITGKREKRN